MILDQPADFAPAAARLAPAARGVARAAFLVSPAGFRLAEESASDNLYMDLGQSVSEARALAEHAELARRLSKSLPIVTFPGDPETPDQVFPNNVWATAPGRLIVGSMRHEVRRREARRADIPRFFHDLLGYERVEIAPSGGVAELTGPLVIDRAREIGYCGLTERCDRRGAEAMHDAFRLAATCVFELQPDEYHTNVFMAVLAGRVLVIHPPSFADASVPEAIARIYAEKVIRLDDEEKAAFAGNCIALDESTVWMSDRAANALSGNHKSDLERWGFKIESAPLEEIEKAGGSLRCCVAEIF
ncbi:MAG: arginine deiminase-related protein [Thermoanaerobaculia bacterium]